jgi:hypothetical protein
MTRRERLNHLRYLACTFMQDRAGAAQTTAELAAAVASLDGILPDNGRSIAFAAAALIFAGCAGMRQFAFDTLEREINMASPTRGHMFDF